MSDGLLENIIQLEKQIQADVTFEEARAGAWQERELASLERARQDAHDATEQDRKDALDEKKSELLRQGEELNAKAAAWCHRLDTIEDTILEAALKRHLAALMPEIANDHPHGQG